MKKWKLCCLAGALFTALVVWTAALGQTPQDPFAARQPEPAKAETVSPGAPSRNLDPLTVAVMRLTSENRGWTPIFPKAAGIGVF
jgi:hypothetical protein